jgi:hypothetical protein
VLALISSSVCLFKLAHPIFLFIESIRWFFLRSLDVVMEQVKQTFRFFLYNLLLTTSPPQPISCIGNIISLGFIKPTKQRMGIYVVLFFEISSLWEVWSFCSSNFQVLRKQSEAKEWIVSVESSALWERRSSTQFYTYLFLYMYVNMYVYVCAIPEGRSAVALNQQPLHRDGSL